MVGGFDVCCGWILAGFGVVVRRFVGVVGGFLCVFAGCGCWFLGLWRLICLLSWILGLCVGLV